jgi:ZIP family zinc transporter
LDGVLLAAVIGSAAGLIGTGFGGVLSFLIPVEGTRILQRLMGLAGGMMIAVVCFDLIPEAFALAGVPMVVLGIALGAGFILILDIGLDRAGGAGKRAGAYIKAGMLLGIGIAAHNLPEGLAIGSGLVAYPSLGLGLAIVIAAHNVPEGLAMAAPMRMGGLSKGRIVLLTLAAGLPTGLGAAMGLMLGQISAWAISLCLGFAGGAMLYVISGEMLPAGAAGKHKGFALSFVAGLMVGMALSIWI